jgi:hypothetical protein
MGQPNGLAHLRERPVEPVLGRPLDMSAYISYKMERREVHVFI